LHNQELEKQR